MEAYILGCLVGFFFPPQVFMSSTNPTFALGLKLGGNLKLGLKIKTELT